MRKRRDHLSTISHAPHKDRNWEKWEKFRDSKLEKMRRHKYNVERRMQMENYLGYSTTKNTGAACCDNKLKRYYPRLSLDSTWYTDNIYSNQSIDLEDTSSFIARKSIKSQDVNHNDDSFDSDDIFIYQTKLKTVNIRQTSGYKYPKSNSCCFGMGAGYEASSMKSKRSNMPKSQSFNDSRIRTNFSKIQEVKHNYDIRKPIIEMIGYHPVAETSINHGGGSDYFLRRVCDREGCVNETCFAKQAPCNNNWNAMMVDPVSRMYDANGNQSEYFTADEETGYEDGARGVYPERLPIVTGYNQDDIVVDIDDDELDDDDDLDDEVFFHETKKHRLKTKSHSFDEATLYAYNHNKGLKNFHRNFLDDDIDELIQNERSKLLMQNKLNKYRDDHLTYTYNKFEDDDILFNSTANLNKIKTKTLLEVNPPNKYDDSSPDSTDLELDDFNFDFIKYWENLNDNRRFGPPPSPPISSPPSDDIPDYVNNNHQCSTHLSQRKILVKNNLMGRYRHNNNNNDEFDNDIDNYDNFVKTKKNLPKFISASPKFSRRKVYPTSDLFYPINPQPSTAPPTNRSTNHRQGRRQNNKNSNPSANDANSNTLNLINNIFSIYKPNKYSPLNSHGQMGKKPETCKKMSVPSTTRPLGVLTVPPPVIAQPSTTKQNEYLTSLKRPLLVNPQYSGTDQPRFKIIPDKTGLKISPLYRFDYSGQDVAPTVSAKSSHHHHQNNSTGGYKLKSTARPLSFRQ